jgi:hypothetical protein
MTRVTPFSKAFLRRVAEVAHEKNFAVVIRPDRTLVMEPRDNPQSEKQPVEPEGEVVL